MSDDQRHEIRAAVSAILRGHATGGDAADGFDRAPWKDLSHGGFHLLGVPEASGGSGGGLGDFAVVAELTAFHAVRAPVVETALLAGRLLSGAGLTVPGGIVAASLDEARGERREGRLRLSGRLRTPWGRHADHVVTLVRCEDRAMVAVLPMNDRGGDTTRLSLAENLAGEPRDTLVLDNRTAEEGEFAAAPPGVDASALMAWGALARSVQLAGASRAVLESAVRYVKEREQFGRPLARFQAVQQQLAALTAEVTAVQVSADAALLAVEAGERDAEVAVAAAKATASAGAQVIAAIGHQLHGAIGYSQEHRLGAATTRLWAWREEFGNESHWQDRLAAAARASGDWWPLITGGTR